MFSSFPKRPSHGECLFLFPAFLHPLLVLYEFQRGRSRSPPACRIFGEGGGIHLQGPPLWRRAEDGYWNQVLDEGLIAFKVFSHFLVLNMVSLCCQDLGESSWFSETIPRLGRQAFHEYWVLQWAPTTSVNLRGARDAASGEAPFERRRRRRRRFLAGQG